MDDNTDLIGKTYRNGEDGLAIWEVVDVDAEFVYAQNRLTGEHCAAIANFVRFNLAE
jgi:hypothetical protein